MWNCKWVFLQTISSRTRLDVEGHTIVMEHKLVSKSGQMESLVVCKGLLDEGHRCDTCHNVSDAKIRIMIKQSKESECTLKVSVYILPSVDCVRALYLRP